MGLRLVEGGGFMAGGRGWIYDLWKGVEVGCLVLGLLDWLTE